MLGAADLSAVDHGGLIPEDVMDKIWDISKIPLPLTEIIGTDSCKAEWKEWVKDELAAPDVSNAYSEKHTWTTEDDSKTGERLRNHIQLLMKRIKVTTRGRDTDEFGTGDTLANQVLRRQQELRRDVESIALQADQISKVDGGAGDGATMGSLGTWLETNVSFGDTGAAGGFDGTTGLTVAPTAGTPRGLTETLVRQTATAVWKEGGDPSVFMSTPDVVDGFSNFLFDTSARVATVQSDVKQSAGGVTAKGFIDVFESNNGVVLKLVGNRLQQVSDPLGTPYHVAYIIDPSYLSFAYTTGYRVEPLSKSGPQEDRQMMVDVTLCVMTEKAHGMISDIDPTTAVEA